MNMEHFEQIVNYLMAIRSIQWSGERAIAKVDKILKIMQYAEETTHLVIAICIFVAMIHYFFFSSCYNLY